jgi:hypothetical protein
MSANGAIALFNKPVLISYIQEMGSSRIFDEIAFNGVFALYNRNVPTEFYTELAERGINNLTFTDVLSLYQNGEN